MLKLLLKKQLTEIFRSYVYDAKKNRARSKAGTAAYIALFVLLMVGVLGGLFTMLSLSLCNTMHAAALDWLYFAILGLLAIFLGAFGSVFNTYAGLYLAKDNDLLLSMPIPVPVLMASRLLGVYLMGLMYSGVVLLPAVIVYWIVAAPSAAAVAGSILLVLLVSIFVLTLSCALGWVVAKISVKLKNKSFLTVLAALVFFGLYYFVYFKAQAVIGDLQQNAAIYGAQIKGSAYPVYLFGSVGAGDGIAMLIVTVVVLGLFILLWRLLARSFLQIATATGGTAKRVYRQREAKRRSISAALLQKELGRFTASPSYMLNCGLGILMLVAGGIVLLFKGQALVSLLDALLSGTRGAPTLVLCMLLCFLASMNLMAAPSVSLEGKSIWMLQSLPVTPWQVLWAKLSLQLLMTALPALFCTICAMIVCPMTALERLLLVVVPLLYVAMMALVNLTLGLKMPNLHWTSEIMPIKQSGGVLLAMLIGFVYSLLQAGYFLAAKWMSAASYLGCYAGLTLVLAALLLGWIKKRGGAIFAAL